MGHWTYPQAFRDSLAGIPDSVTPVFWGVRRV
jgi:hypothetical protein